MKTIRALAVVTSSLLLFSLPVQAQTIDELRDHVQSSVCRYDWNSALTDLGCIIGSSDISTDYREALMLYRRQIQAWRDTRTTPDTSELPECQKYLVEVNDAPEPPQAEPIRLNWDRAVSSMNDTSASSCHPSYPSVCIPSGSADLDCGDISHRNFRVLSPDPHRFDGDGDGFGCERR